MKKYSHIPKHLQPVRIPRIRIEKKKNHRVISKYAFFLIFSVAVAFVEKSKKKETQINIQGTGYGT